MPGKSGLHARGEGERVLALESREGTRASRRVEEGLSRSFSGGGGNSDGKVSAYNAGDLDSIPGSGRSSGEGNGNALQDSCLENPMDGRAW